MAEYADAKNEKKILEYLTSAQGQAAFCDLRTGPHITLAQLLHAFPSSKPPLSALLSVLTQLMPRFYSLSNDPHVSSSREGLANRRLIEMAVSVHETPDWRGGHRTGIGSGYLERMAHKFIEAQASGFSEKTGGPAPAQILDLRIPMFRGLMANPLSREFISDGPMMLIGAGVGMAPFRGFILNRLKNANCANKIWLVQGVRDSMLDEIYSGELGDHEREIKKVVQSRKANRTMNEARYVQDEVRLQADVVWFVANALDGRVFVCGSSKGMGEGVHSALVEVAMEKGALNKYQAEQFWERKKEGGQYIAVSYTHEHTFVAKSNHL
jgi:sulfite reductase alpha subunit-like flavoprotein